MMFTTSKHSRNAILMALVVAVGLSPTFSRTSRADDRQVENKPIVIGPKFRMGGRFDNVRMCVATPADTRGGPAADISLSAEIALSGTVSLDMDLPVFRPLLFGVSFQMLQFEPSVTLKFRRQSTGRVDLIGGPTLGISMHYGPDYHSERSGGGRTSSFFALGPMVGGYLGVDVKRPKERFNLQLGVTPYVEPLFGINDARNHRGVVAGGLFDIQLRFGKPRAEG